MKVCIPIEFKPQGGGFHFLQLLSTYLIDQGWLVTKRLEDHYDILFTNHWQVSRLQILHAIRHNLEVRIVQRIDGAAQDYGRSGKADVRQHRVNLLADLTIFQSHYCRYSTREKFPVIVQDGPVIHNPVDVELFCPEGPRLSFPQSVRVACVTWSTNPLKGAASIYAVARHNRQIGFVLCGHYSDMPDLPNLHRLGILGREELATVLRSCHLLLTFSQNEACPNHVLEALASGLPVLYHDSGAMSEVISDPGLPVTVESFAVQLAQIMDQREQLSLQARQRAMTHFHPQIILPRYVEEMQAVLRRPTTVSLARRRWLARSSFIPWRGRQVAAFLWHRWKDLTGRRPSGG